MFVEFETQLEDNIIHLPEEIAAQLKNGMAVHVSIRAVESEDEAVNPDQAWQAFLKTAADRNKLPTGSEAYNWKREDAYEHLK
jgi:hypothetical protein